MKFNTMCLEKTNSNFIKENKTTLLIYIAITLIRKQSSIILTNNYLLQMTMKHWNFNKIETNLWSRLKISFPRKTYSKPCGCSSSSLAKPPERITLLDIYKAVEGDRPLLHLDTHTNPECGVGMNIQFTLHDYYQEVQEAAKIELLPAFFTVH